MMTNCLSRGRDVAVQFRRRDEGAAAIFLSRDQAAANPLIERRAADTQDARRLRDLEAKVRKGFRSIGHWTSPCQGKSTLG